MVRQKQYNKQYHRYGFTLVEVLLVVIILGILATTVLPQFVSTNDEAKESALAQDLQTLRKQFQLYKYQHSEKFPGDGSTDPKLVEDQLLLSSDADGTTGPAGTKPFGPYLIGQLPANPFSGARGFKIVSDVAATASDDSPTEGWIYNPATGRIKANSTGKTVDGKTNLADL